MIARYFMIITKDKEGFSVPYATKNSAPILYLDQASAEKALDFQKRTFQSKIDYVADKPSFGRLLRPKNEQISYSAEDKKEMRWFIANATVQGVTLHL